jgi:hypothetical protein
MKDHEEINDAAVETVETEKLVIPYGSLYPRRWDFQVCA